MKKSTVLLVTADRMWKKSTLLNNLPQGRKLRSITRSLKTTRHQGPSMRDEDAGKVIFVDHPESSVKHKGFLFQEINESTLRTLKRVQ